MSSDWCRMNVLGTICVLGIHGRFDYNHHRDFRMATDEAMKLPDVTEYVVELRNTSYLDSSALGMLLTFRDSAQARGRKVALANASGIVKQILGVANFNRMFEMR